MAFSLCGTGRSSTDTFLGPWKTTAFIVFVDMFWFLARYSGYAVNLWTIGTNVKLYSKLP